MLEMNFPRDDTHDGSHTMDRGAALALGAIGWTQRKRFAKRLRVVRLRGAYGGQVG
jgi:hypothetical protein